MVATMSLLVAAPASASGKTVVTVGLVRALALRGLPVRAAKVGPDYIDPGFLAAAAGAPAVNLDPWAMRPALLDHLAADACLVVEGVMGLFDGAASGVGSSADVARRLGLPVVLVVDARRQSQSVAALVHGFATFDPAIHVAGVILTRVAGPRHERMLRAALAGGAVPCLGAIAHEARLALPSRHLGLEQAVERTDLEARVDAIARVVADHCDIATLAALAAAPAPAAPAAPPPAALPPLGQRIAFARDEAFGFVYPHLLEGWCRAGASLHPFSPLAGEAPDGTADAVFLPGGYPELHAGRLAATPAWREGLRAAARAGARIYGECGGYMALGEGLIDGDGTRHAMAGLLPVVTSFARPRRTLGYRQLVHHGTMFPRHLRGHEFHYATVAAEGPPLFRAADSTGADLGTMGTVHGAVAGSFVHLIDVAGPDVAGAAGNAPPAPATWNRRRDATLPLVDTP